MDIQNDKLLFATLVVFQVTWQKIVLLQQRIITLVWVILDILQIIILCFLKAILQVQDRIEDHLLHLQEEGTAQEVLNEALNEERLMIIL